jgi:hypothetical protein
MARHCRQVVLEIPETAITAPLVRNLVTSDSIMWSSPPWAIVLLKMSDGRGPFLFVKAEGTVEQLRDYPVRVAFAFYYLQTAGVFQIFVHVPSPEVERFAHNPFIVERVFDLNDDLTEELFSLTITRAKFEIAIVAPGRYGSFTGHFGWCTDLQKECSNTLRREFNLLMDYHRQIPLTQRNLKPALEQYNRENPLEANPILVTDTAKAQEHRETVAGKTAGISAGRCPRCGFTYKWDGKHCGYCGHSST